MYGAKNIKITNTIVSAPLSSSYRLEFVQNQNLPFGGVRAQEFIAVVPEPSVLAPAALAIGILRRNQRLSVS